MHEAEAPSVAESAPPSGPATCETLDSPGLVTLLVAPDWSIVWPLQSVATASLA